MWFFAIFAIFGASFAAPGYFFYGPPAYQRLFMYNREPIQRQTVQYQPQWMHQVSSTSEGEVSAFVAGNSGSAGTIYQPSSPSIEQQYFVTEDPNTKTEQLPSEVPPTKKKVQVLVESEEDEEDFLEKRPRQKPSPGHFFPATFGSADGAAIAIANSYSPGRGGSAVSHATAYGNPMERKKPREIQNP